MQNPSLTIVVVLYNHSRWIKDIVSDIYSQTFKKVKIIFSDDCSNDNTLEELEKSLEKEKLRKFSHFLDFKVLTSNFNRGIIDHFNYILKIVDTDYIFMISGDDRIHEKFCEELIPKLERKFTCITPNQYRINDDNRIIDKSNYEQNGFNSLEDIVLKGNFGIPSSGSIYNLNSIKKFGKLDKNLSNEDDQFLFRTMLEGSRLIVNSHLFFYRVHSASASSWHRKPFLPRKVLFDMHLSELKNKVNHLLSFKSILVSDKFIQINRYKNLIDLIDTKIETYSKKYSKFQNIQYNKSLISYYLELLFRLRAIKIIFRFWIGIFIRNLKF